MTRTIRYAIAAIVVLATAALSAQGPDITWMRTYGGDNDDIIYAVNAVGDGYIIAGKTTSFGAGNADLYILRTDANGDSLWMTVWGTSRQEHGRDVISCSGGGYAVVGNERLIQNSYPQIVFHRLDAAGNIVNTRNYGHIGADEAWSIVETSDGGFAIAGITDVSNSGQTDVYLVRTDASGDTLWTRAWGGGDDDEGHCVEQTPDGGFVVAGNTLSFGAGSADIYLLRVDAFGDTLWSRTYGGSSGDWGRCVRLTSDGGFVVAGYTSSYGAGQSDMYLVKTDAGGDTLWTRTYGLNHYEYCNSVVEVNNGYTLVGHSESFGAFKDLYIVRTNLFGDTLWTKVIGGDSQDWGYDIESTADGGYIVAGYTNSYGASDNDAWLIKLGYDPTGIDNHTRLPALQVKNHPNPFNPTTTITYRLPDACHVTVKVFDASGRRVATLYDGEKEAGQHNLRWNAAGFRSSVYFVQLDASGETRVAKAVLLK
ncbi:MAG: T9SS type A sorting domain-containing protein [Candidatus Krumholzibacteria bacterium]|nr:T9SS type A sorting domain-containing protein [Candidatus Krumholzibacteria bacterium]